MANAMLVLAFRISLLDSAGNRPAECESARSRIRAPREQVENASNR
jgi:hypothetical protein